MWTRAGVETEDLRSNGTLGEEGPSDFCPGPRHHPPLTWSCGSPFTFPIGGAVGGGGR